jgi:Flp pilus assembly protein TadB
MMIFLLFVNRPYIMPLFLTDGGHYMLLAALFVWTIGFLWMRSMIKVKL